MNTSLPDGRDRSLLLALWAEHYRTEPLCNDHGLGAHTRYLSHKEGGKYIHTASVEDPRSLCEYHLGTCNSSHLKPVQVLNS